MPNTQINNIRRVLALGALASLGLAPTMAHAQFQANSLYGKTYPEVTKILGKPVQTSGNPLTFSRFKTPGALDTIVWYFYNTGQVGKVQIQILPQPGETAADADKVLKRYGLAIGPSPHVFPGVKPPAKSMVSVGAVPGMPWTKVFISYLNAMSFKPELMAYCKKNHLDPSKTFFWTIQVSNRKPSGERMIGAGDEGDGGKGKGKGKGKSGGKKGKG